MLRQEVARGFEISWNVEHGKAKWEDLVRPHEFFCRYKYYLQVDVSTYGATAPLEAVDNGSGGGGGDVAEMHRKWFGFCESRLRAFVAALENTPGVQAQPHAELFHWSPNDALVAAGDSSAATSDAAPAKQLALGTSTDQSDSQRLQVAQSGSSDASLSSASTSAATDPSTAVASTAGRTIAVTSYFVALTFAPHIQSIDLMTDSDGVREWVHKLSSWEGRKVGMDLQMAIMKCQVQCREGGTQNSHYS